MVMIHSTIEDKINKKCGNCYHFIESYSGWGQCFNNIKGKISGLKVHGLDYCHSWKYDER